MLNRNAVICPKCHTAMEFSMETESFGNGIKKVSTFYKCPVCGYRIQDMVIEVNRYNGSAKLKLSKYF
ncbi:MAG TPA: hypothetical protein ENO36_01740 [Fervidicoccus fontis]|uniref:Uncharacterized protein n=1 Tax=Fervidicoccus fontis TaxID=683846 RepID=A0A7C2UJ54_9CREN|nr:MAG: hypothetical protein C0177_03020 [Fervidicoccus fontis]HEU97562.1 hypothetical protein [Fervidicoccus fontis]